MATQAKDRTTLTKEEQQTIILGLEGLEASLERKANGKGVDKELEDIYKQRAAKVGALIIKIRNYEIDL